MNVTRRAASIVIGTATGRGTLIQSSGSITGGQLRVGNNGSSVNLSGGRLAPGSSRDGASFFWTGDSVE